MKLKRFIRMTAAILAALLQMTLIVACTPDSTDEPHGTESGSSSASESDTTTENVSESESTSVSESEDESEDETETPPPPDSEPLSDILQNVFTSSKIVNETVMFIDYGDAKTLLHTPDEILSVTSYDGKTTYVAGKDYELKDGKLVILEGSSMPCITSAVYYNGDGTIHTLGANKQSLYWGENDTMTQWQVCVNYTHSEAWEDYTQPCYADRFTDFIGKLERGEDVTVYFYGDSITAGANASYFVGIEPKQQPYTVLFLQALAETYDYTVKFVDATPGTLGGDIIPEEDLVCGTRGTITYLNSAIGGWTTNDGLQHMDQVLTYIETYGCDLFVSAFGMNDGNGSGSLVADIQRNMFKSILEVAPKASFLVVATMVPHPGTNWYNAQAYHYIELLKFADKQYNKGIPCAMVNMTEVSLAVYQYKTFEDCTGNNINHPNDFLNRIYAQTLYQALIGYENTDLA